MRFLWGTQAEADVSMVLVAGLVLVCLVVFVACAALGAPLGAV
ncbi:MAG TPA: hypothetical protein PKZ84_13275 [Anaerolineae bacterium]|nr:hypothetical protein [Anaerolineae bacterium]HQI86463.1 hypothetical protein [Anaerolineae bacterium]